MALLGEAVRSIQLQRRDILDPRRDREVYAGMGLDDVAQKRRRQSLAKVGWAHNQRADLSKSRLNLFEFSNGGETTVQPDAKEAGLSVRDLRGRAMQRHEVHNAENGTLDTIGREHDGTNRVCHVQGRMVELDNLAGAQRRSPSN